MIEIIYIAAIWRSIFSYELKVQIKGNTGAVFFKRNDGWVKFLTILKQENTYTIKTDGTLQEVRVRLCQDDGYVSYVFDIIHDGVVVAGMAYPESADMHCPLRYTSGDSDSILGFNKRLLLVALHTATGRIADFHDFINNLPILNSEG